MLPDRTCDHHIRVTANLRDPVGSKYPDLTLAPVSRTPLAEPNQKAEAKALTEECTEVQFLGSEQSGEGCRVFGAREAKGRDLVQYL